MARKSFVEWVKTHPPLLDTTLESGFRVVTFQQPSGRFETLVHLPGIKRGSIKALRKAETEEAARADFAAFVGEFGP